MNQKTKSQNELLAHADNTIIRKTYNQYLSFPNLTGLKKWRIIL